MKIRITITLDVNPNTYQVPDWTWNHKPSQAIIREAIKGELITVISDSIDTTETHDDLGVTKITFQ